MVALAWTTTIEGSDIKALPLMKRCNYNDIKQQVKLTPPQKDFCLFLECRNLSRVFHKNCHQSVSVIYQRPNGTWHFGILLDANLVEEIVMVLQWNGIVDNDGIPKYAYMEKEDFFLQGWKDHFSLEMIIEPK